jgi:hypothetical protein
MVSRKRPGRVAGTKRPRASKAPARAVKARSKRNGSVVATSGGVTVTEVAELDALRREIERVASASGPPRWNAAPEDVQKSVAQLVLTLVEFIRRLLERQAIRRMEAGTLTDEETENVGVALMKLEETVRDIAAKFGLGPDELNLEVGPLGKLM